MNFLQIDPTTIETHFMEFGILGIISFLLGYFAWHSYKRLADKNDALEEKVDKMQAELTMLLIDERDRLSQIINENTKAINDLRNIIITTLIKKEDEPKRTRTKKVG
jgi:hypothetical protein